MLDAFLDDAAAGDCPDEGVLADFVSGGLDDDERDELREHFDACPRCSDTLALMVGAFDDGTGQSLTGTATGNHPALTTLSGPFAGRYEIRECVGFGAGGTVYAAYDPELERVVALKVLRGSSETREDGSTRPDTKWTREAKTTAKVVHPNVVAVHDVGVAGEHVFIATEFVAGGSLEEWVREREHEWREVLDLFVPCAEGLAAIHACGLVHRDFKPHNVLVGRDGRPRVTDFGLARLLPEAEDFEDHPTAEHVLASVEIGETIATRTRTGMLVGTPAYMSPEQWRGRPADARSDQFSYCVALYEALWGRRPFGGKSSLELSERVCEGRMLPIPPGSKVPRWLERVVMRGLSVDPAQRFSSMRALLDAIADGPRRAGRRRMVAVLTAGFVGVAGMGYALASIPEEACTRDDGRFAGVWDESMRAEIEGRWPDVAFGKMVSAQLDDLVEQWHAANGELCRAAKVEGRLSERQHELRVSCLDRRVAEVQAATQVLRSTDAQRALNVVGTVGSPERCGDAEELARIEPAWTDSESRVLAAQMAGELARVESLRAAGEFDAALELGRTLVERADEDGDPALRAEALTELGLTLSSTRQGHDAVKVLRDAVWAAEASGHVRQATNAWIELVEVMAGITEDYDEAERALERADAAAHRLGDPEQVVHVASARGLLMSARGDYDDALRTHLKVIEDAEKVFGERDPQIARMHMNVAAVLSHLGRVPEALEHAFTGVEIFETEVSPVHPELVEFLNTVGALQLQMRDIPAARETYARALKIAETGLDAGDRYFATLYSNLAHADIAEGKPEAAIGQYQKALDIYREAHGENHPDIALTLHNLAGAIDDAGDQERAIEIYRDALRIRIETLGEEHPGTAATQHNLGLLLFSTGNVDDGIAMMEKARATREEAGIDPFKRATTRFMLARAYREKGEHETAEAYAREAVVQLQKIAPRRKDILEHIEAWLAKYYD